MANTPSGVTKLTRLHLSAFHSTAAGDGAAVNPNLDSTYTAVERIYGDDGGTAVGASGSVPDLRVGLARMLLTTDHTSYPVRVWGAMGQVKAYDAYWNNEQVSGVHGYLELQRSTATMTLGGYGVSAGVSATVESTGTITVNTNHTLAGVAAISKLTSGLTQTGKTAAFYAGIYDVTNWSDGTARSKWKYGLYIQASAVNRAIQAGEQANTSGSGVLLDATYSAALQIFTDDGGAAIASSVLTRAGRFRNLQTYTGGNREQEAVGAIGQIVSVAGTNRHNMAGLMGSYEAATSLTVDGQAWSTDPWIQAGVIGRVGVGTAITTVNANGVLAGLAAMSNTVSFVAQNGIYAGLYVGSWSGTIDWQYGVYVQGGAVSRAFQAGEQANTAGSGVTLNATYPAAMQIFTDDGNAAIASSVLTRAGRFRNLQVYTGGNREQEAVGAIGQLVSVAGTNRHNMAGLMGSYEGSSALTVDGQASATDPWIQAGVIGRVGVGSGTTTINANGKLIGVAAMSNTASFSANNGAYIGFYAGRWGSNSDWGYGLFMENVSIGITLTATGDGAVVTSTTLDPITGRVGKFYGTMAAPNMADGYGAFEVDFTLSGTMGATGFANASSSWVNIPTGTVGAGKYVCARNDGVYEASAATITNAKIIFGARMHKLLDDTDALSFPFSLNTNNTAITALFDCNNTTDFGTVANAGASAATLVPFMRDAGGTLKYILLYNLA